MDNENNVSKQFVENIKIAIEVMTKLDGASTDAQILQEFEEKNINKSDAAKILIYLPIAFCRRLLPDFDWPDDYVLINEASTHSTVKRFSQDRIYMVVRQQVLDYYSHQPDKEVVLKIAGRSSEFHTINKLLIAGVKLEDIKLTPLHILWGMFQ